MPVSFLPSPADAHRLGTPRRIAALRPLSLPDLTGAAEPVQTQLRERYASLQRLVDSPGTPASDLADAYGEMGKLLLATEYLDAAESCFTNAQVLVPDAMRWPYYLGHVHRLKSQPAKRGGNRSRGRSPCNRITCRPWCGLARCTSRKASRESAEPLFSRALSIQPRAAAALVRVGPRGAGDGAVRGGRHPSERGTRARTAGLAHSVSAGDGLPRTGRSPERRGTPAPARRRRGAFGRSVDGRGRGTAAERRRLRGPWIRGARQARVGRRHHESAQGDRVVARQLRARASTSARPCT